MGTLGPGGGNGNRAGAYRCFPRRCLPRRPSCSQALQIALDRATKAVARLTGWRSFFPAQG